MSFAPQELTRRERDPAREQRERLRFEILRRIYEQAAPALQAPVKALHIGLSMGLTREELFRTVLELTHRHYLNFCSAGPQVRVTQKAVEYLERDAGKRQSIRDS